MEVPNPIMQFPLSYEEKQELVESKMPVKQVDSNVSKPTELQHSFNDVIPPTRSQLDHEPKNDVIPPHSHPLHSNSQPPSHPHLRSTSDRDTHITGVSTMATTASHASPSQRQRFIMRIRREMELLTESTNNSAYMATQYFPHLFTNSSTSTLSTDSSARSLHPSHPFPHSPLLDDSTVWRTNSINYDALRNQMKKIVYIQGQIATFIRRDREEATDKDSMKNDNDSVSMEPSSTPTQSHRPDRTPRPLDPVSPPPPPGELSNSTVHLLTSHPSIHTLRQSHETFWKLLKVEVGKMIAFMEHEVHSIRTEQVWNMMTSSVSTSVTVGKGKNVIDLTRASEHGLGSIPTPTAVEPSICSCGCGSVLKEVFRYVLNELQLTGCSSATPTLNVDGRETPVCKLAKETTQKFMCSLLHMDQIRKYLTHNYIIYQRVLHQYQHYTASPLIDKYHVQLGLAAPAPPALESTEITIQQQQLQAFVTSTSPFVPLTVYLHRMARVEVLSLRSFERGATFENIGSEMSYLLASMAPPVCGVCQTPNMVASILLPCAHTMCFGCLALQTNFGICCPLSRCQHELTAHADLKARVSMEEWIKAGSNHHQSHYPHSRHLHTHSDAHSRPSSSHPPAANKSEPIVAMVVTSAPEDAANSQGVMPALLPSAPSISSEQAKLQRKLWALHQQQQQGNAHHIVHQFASSSTIPLPPLDEHCQIQKVSPTMSSFSEDDASMTPAGVAPVNVSASSFASHGNAPSLSGHPSTSSNIRTQMNDLPTTGASLIPPQRHIHPSPQPSPSHSSDAHHLTMSHQSHPPSESSSVVSSPRSHSFERHRRYSLGDAYPGTSASSVISEDYDHGSRRYYASNAPHEGGDRLPEATARLIAQHQPCEGDDQPLSDEDLQAGRFILGCGGTIAAPLAYEEVTTTNADGTISVHMKPKRGSGYSCHCCKTTKDPLLLYFCSNLLKKNKNLKKCQKKYCESCLKRLYPPELSLGGRYWLCPSCKGQCVCASCERKMNGHTSARKKKGANNVNAMVEANVLHTSRQEHDSMKPHDLHSMDALQSSQPFSHAHSHSTDVNAVMEIRRPSPSPASSPSSQSNLSYASSSHMTMSTISPSFSSKSTRGGVGLRSVGTGRGRGRGGPAAIRYGPTKTARARSNSMDYTGPLGRPRVAARTIARVIAGRYPPDGNEEFSPLSAYYPASENTSPSSSPRRTPAPVRGNSGLAPSSRRRHASSFSGAVPPFYELVEGPNGTIISYPDQHHPQYPHPQQQQQHHHHSHHRSSDLPPTGPISPTPKRYYQPSHSVPHSHSSSPYHMHSAATSAGSSVSSSQIGSHITSDVSDGDTPTNRLAVSRTIGRTPSPSNLDGSSSSYASTSTTHARSIYPTGPRRSQTYDPPAQPASIGFNDAKSALSNMSYEELQEMNQNLEIAMRQLQSDEYRHMHNSASNSGHANNSAFFDDTQDHGDEQDHHLPAPHQPRRRPRQASANTPKKPRQPRKNSRAARELAENAQAQIHGNDTNAHASSIMSIHVHAPPPLPPCASPLDNNGVFLSHVPFEDSHYSTAQMHSSQPHSRLVDQSGGGMVSPLDAPLLSPQMLDDMISMSPSGFLQPVGSPFQLSHSENTVSHGTDQSHPVDGAAPGDGHPLGLNISSLMTPTGLLVQPSPSWPSGQIRLENHTDQSSQLTSNHGVSWDHNVNMSLAGMTPNPATMGDTDQQ